MSTRAMALAIAADPRKVRELLVARGVAAAQLARLLELHPKTVQRFLRGDTDSTLVVRFALLSVAVLAAS